MSLQPIILYREDQTNLEEETVASRHFEVLCSRVGISNSLVIGRYSVLPFYKELELDLEIQSSRLINSFAQHQYVANFDYYEDLKHLTPKTYFNLADVPKDGGPFVVKGRTNSRKFDWERKMFAPTYQDAARIVWELEMDDALVREQGAIIREFVPLKVLEVGINGLPFANEWRFFFYKRDILCFEFYWTIAEQRGEMDADGIAFAQEVGKIASQRVNFFVVDIAEKASGGWVLIELNDGQMSGLSGCDPELLYRNLNLYLAGETWQRNQ